MNIYEAAARRKLRFPSARGELTAEQLWDLPLLAKSPTRDVKVDLDTIARSINAELRSVTEESFVNVRPDSRKTDLETKLEIVKHVIATKQTEAETIRAAAARAEERRKLAEALAKKQDQKLDAMTEEEILEKLKKLEDA